MTQQKKLMFCAMMSVLLTLSCGQLQAPTALPVPSSTLTVAPTRTPRPTYTLYPTHTPAPIATYPPIDPGPFQRVVSLPEALQDSPQAVRVHAPADGSVWVITSQSVFRWDGQEVNRVHSMEEDTLADVDESGRLWMFQQDIDEITAWQNGQWTTYGAESGWTSIQTSPGWAPKPLRVTTAKDGTIWLPTDQDVRHFNGQRWTIHTREEMGFPPPEQGEEDEKINYRIGLVSGGAQIWVGECRYGGPGPIDGSGVRWFDGATWHGENIPVGSACISTLDSDSAGNLWISADNVIWRYEPTHQKWTSYPLPETIWEENYNFAYPLTLIVDHTGDIWVYLEYCGGASCGVSYGLHRIHAGEWSAVFEPSMGSTFSHQLVLDGSGQGWLFWNEMVYRLEGNALKQVAEFPTLDVDVSPDGKMWVVTNDALWVFKP
jgi:hypothetical protein